MKEIEELDADDQSLRERFNTLVEDITHHVQEEKLSLSPPQGRVPARRPDRIGCQD